MWRYISVLIVFGLLLSATFKLFDVFVYLAMTLVFIGLMALTVIT